MANKPRESRRAKFTKPYPRAVCVDDKAYLGADENGCLSGPRPGARFLVSLTLGKAYEICGEDLDLGWWSVIDNSGDSYLYPKSYFRILPPHDAEGRLTAARPIE